MLIPKPKAAKIYFISITILVMSYSLYYLHTRKQISGTDDAVLKGTENPLNSDVDKSAALGTKKEPDDVVTVVQEESEEEDSSVKEEASNVDEEESSFEEQNTRYSSFDELNSSDYDTAEDSEGEEDAEEEQPDFEDEEQSNGTCYSETEQQQPEVQQQTIVQDQLNVEQDQFNEKENSSEEQIEVDLVPSDDQEQEPEQTVNDVTEGKITFSGSEDNESVIKKALNDQENNNFVKSVTNEKVEYLEIKAEYFAGVSGSDDNTVTAKANEPEPALSIGYSLLHNAAVSCDPKAIRSLVEAHPEIFNEKTTDGQQKTAMVLVIESKCEADAGGRIECLKALKGARVNDLCGGEIHQYTALYAAIKRNEPELIDYLISIGASIDMFYQGRPLLHHAIEHCTSTTFPSVFKMFKKRGVDLRIENSRNRMAIHEAAALDKDYAIKVLSEYCDIDARTPKYRRNKTYLDSKLRERKTMYGATAVHVAARFNSEAAYLQLKELGAEMNKKDSFDKKPKFYNNTFAI